MKSLFILMVSVHAGFAQPADLMNNLRPDYRNSYIDVNGLRAEVVFDQIRSALSLKRSLNDTTLYTVQFSLRRGMGILTEEMNYSPLQGEGYKPTLGPPNAFHNDKQRQANIEKFEVQVLDPLGVIWKGGYALEVNRKKTISEKEQKMILKRIAKSCAKFKI